MKILVIDDLKNELNSIEKYLKIKSINIHCEKVCFKKCSGTDVTLYTHEEQKNKLKEKLNAEWDNSDVFLIDLLLIEKSVGGSQKLVSLSAIEEFLDENKNCFEQVKNNEKRIIIITSYWIQSCTFSVNPKIKDMIVFVNKPLWDGEPQPISNELCGAIKYCDKYNGNENSTCDQNDCLYELIKTFYERKK